MEQQAYRDMINSRPYTGLQMIKMEYNEARQFAGIYGMNAIVSATKPPYNFRLVRLNNTEDGLTDGINLINKDTEEIYWVGLK